MHMLVGRCEICKTKFHFDPQYAENTPDRLPAHEVILGLSSRFLAKWLPLALRICFAICLWLVVAPYLTNCLYLGWIVRPSSILSRQETFLSDVVSGAVMGAIIIISFLSLMSFADFLRVLWQQPPGAQQPEAEERQEEGMGNDGADAENTDDEANGNTTDDRIIEFIERKEKEATIEALVKKPSDTEIDKTMSRSTSVFEQKDFETKMHNIDNGTDSIETMNMATELRNLAMEREARQRNDRGLAGDNDEDDMGIDPILPLADDQDGIPPRQMANEEDFDYDSDDGIVNENADDDDEEAWMDNDEDDNDEDDALPPFQPPGAEPIDDGVAFDPMDPVLQDDQVVSTKAAHLNLIRFMISPNSFFSSSSGYGDQCRFG